MALPATDAFTGTDGTALATYSASWTVMQGSIQISSNTARGMSSAGNADALWNADTFSDDQYSQAVISERASGIYVAVSLRASGANTYYQASFDNGSGGFAGLYKVVSGTATLLGSHGAAAVSDLIRIEATGTTIVSKKNGTTLVTVTDSAIASGSAGFGFYSTSGTAPRIDDWEGGNIGGGGASGNPWYAYAQM